MKDRDLLDQRVSALKARTLVLSGGADRVFDASGADVLRSRLKQARVAVLSGLGHLPMMEAPKDAARRCAELPASPQP